ncbi:MAG: transcriptional regulator [Bacteroidetes bacterium CG_4_10_14_3_um_filter_31_20]|nr:MAG: transcriptional regulator [Bacteroidetes bacterium CG_4_10_14_3_um_filter_31_20]
MDIKKKFGKNLKRLRLEKGISQESLALSADLDRTYIPSIEKGVRNVSITVVEKLANALNVSIVEFFKDEQ